MSTQIHNVMDTAVFFFKWPTICPQNRTKKDGKVVLKFSLAVYLIGLDISIPLNNQYFGVLSGQGQTLQRERSKELTVTLLKQMNYYPGLSVSRFCKLQPGYT